MFCDKNHLIDDVPSLLRYLEYCKRQSRPLTTVGGSFKRRLLFSEAYCSLSDHLPFFQPSTTLPSLTLVVTATGDIRLVCLSLPHSHFHLQVQSRSQRSLSLGPEKPLRFSLCACHVFRSSCRFKPCSSQDFYLLHATLTSSFNGQWPIKLSFSSNSRIEASSSSLNCCGLFLCVRFVIEKNPWLSTNAS